MYLEQQGLWLPEEEILPYLAPLGEYRGIDLVGDSLVFICLDERGIMSVILDLELTSNPPDSIGWAETPGSAHDVIYHDGYLFIADYFGGLIVMDASNPRSLTQVAQVIPSGATRCEKIIVDGDEAAVLDSYDGIYVFDISVPTAPVVIDRIDLPEPQGMTFYGGWLLVTDEARGLLIFQR